MKRLEARAYRRGLALWEAGELDDAELLARVRREYPMPRARLLEVLAPLLTRPAERALRKAHPGGVSLTLGDTLALLERLTDDHARVSILVSSAGYDDAVKVVASIRERVGAGHDLLLWTHPEWARRPAVAAQRRRIILRSPLKWRPKRMRCSG